MSYGKKRPKRKCGSMHLKAVVQKVLKFLVEFPKFQKNSRNSPVDSSFRGMVRDKSRNSGIKFLSAFLA